MCGIAGLVNVAGAHKAHVRTMVDKIIYRGVDNQATKNLGNAILGHARLNVVDLQSGNQPMSDEAGKIWVVFNGEIYNFLRLKKMLQEKGYKFRTSSDTEILIHLWREKGERMLDDLIGMFAFFIWDEDKNRGILARDRQGVKPCFITNYKGGIAFASEIKALLTLPEMHKKINADALAEVFTYNYVIPPHTCFEGIEHLKPGHYLLFEDDANALEKCYWSWPVDAPKYTPSFEEFSELLDDAIQLQTHFDVDGGIYLSGGVDSSVTLAHLNPAWPYGDLQATGLDFSEKQYSEYEYSKYAASVSDIDLERALIEKEMIPEIAEKVSYHAEQPHGDFSFFIFYVLSRRAHAQGKVVMFSGDAPDEICAGYRHYVNFFGEENAAKNFSAEKYLPLISYMNATEKSEILNADFVQNTSSENRFAQMLEPYKNLHAVEQVGIYDLHGLLQGNSLVKVERMGAAFSTEVRSPFLDHRVSEMMMRLPVEEKFANGVGKKYLKNYAATKYDPDFIFKKKSMPTAPIGVWLANDLYGWARDVISAHAPEEFINKNAALKILDEHKAGAQNHTSKLRTIIMTSIWNHVYFGR